MHFCDAHTRPLCLVRGKYHANGHLLQVFENELFERRIHRWSLDRYEEMRGFEPPPAPVDERVGAECRVSISQPQRCAS